MANPSFQVQHGICRVNGEFLTGWHVITKSGRYVGTAQHLREVPAIVARAALASAGGGK